MNILIKKLIIIFCIFFVSSAMALWFSDNFSLSEKIYYHSIYRVWGNDGNRKEIFNGEGRYHKVNGPLGASRFDEIKLKHKHESPDLLYFKESEERFAYVEKLESSA